jgi:hypothetical protein
MADANEVLAEGFEKSLSLQQPQAAANVERLRHVHPDKTPRKLIKYPDRTYLPGVTALGPGCTSLTSVNRPGA